MIKFWYFVIQNLDKACYINFLIGTLVQLWVACPPYLLISSKHRIQAEKDYNLWTDFKWLCKIFRDYAMTNKFLHRMDIKLMPWSQHTLCVLRSWIIILIRPSSSLLLPPSNIITFEGSEPLSDNDEIVERFHILFIVYLPSAPFSMLESLSYATWVPCIIKVSSVVSVKLWKPPSDVCMPAPNGKY